MYRTEIKVVTMDTDEWIKSYCDPEKFIPMCRECPDYAKRWSCPPDVPKVMELLGDRKKVEIIGMKVIYDEETKAQALKSYEETERLRQATYGKAKRDLHDGLMTLERLFPDSVSIMAGRCELCDRCTRPEGKPCRYPEKMRYSYSGLGFNLVGVAEDILDMPLLWQTKGLPEYNVAMASLLHN